MMDAVATVRGWANANTSLTGPGKPVALGFFEKRLRSPGRGCYGLVAAALAGDGIDAEGTTSLWRLHVTVLSATDAEAAERGALALVTALRGISAAPPTVGGVRMLMATKVTADREPVVSDDEPTYTVQCDLYLA